MPRLPQAFHAHFSGIEYTAKGEKKHIRTQPAHFQPLLDALINHHKNMTLICESPKPFEGAIMMKGMLEQQKKNN